MIHSFFVKIRNSCFFCNKNGDEVNTNLKNWKSGFTFLTAFHRGKGPSEKTLSFLHPSKTNLVILGGKKRSQKIGKTSLYFIADFFETRKVNHDGSRISPLFSFNFAKYCCFFLVRWCNYFCTICAINVIFFQILSDVERITQLNTLQFVSVYHLFKFV